MASWTASFADEHRRLATAAARLGLWPAAAPDEEPAATVSPLLRRSLAAPHAGTTGSLTATVRGGRITAISVFDEAPEWL